MYASPEECTWPPLFYQYNVAHCKHPVHVSDSLSHCLYCARLLKLSDSPDLPAQQTSELRWMVLASYTACTACHVAPLPSTLTARWGSHGIHIHIKILCIMLFMACPRSVCLSLWQPPARCATPVFSLERLVVLPSPSLSLVLGIPCFCLSVQDTLYMLSALELKSLWEKPPVITNTCCHRSSLVVTFSTLLQRLCSLIFLALLTGYVSVCYPGMWVHAWSLVFSFRYTMYPS